MKSTQKVTRVKLNVEQNNDYILLGLVSAEPDYKLSISLNKKFRILLKNIAPLRLTGDKHSELIFSRFSNNNNPPDLVFYLISNRTGKNFLINKLKNIDYLLQIQVSDKEVNLNNITSSLREIDSITAVFNIDINTVKDKNLDYLTQ
ncbi:MAG: IPExxxVDY family protein [Bacteroidales bacterium]